MSKQPKAARCKCGNPATAGPNPLTLVSRCVGCASLSVVNIPATTESKAAPPAGIVAGPAWPAAEGIAPDGRLWRHQAQALQELAAGRNTVVATSTASGKSLIFQLWALHQAATVPESTALVFYPTKALANDQARRWEESAASVGLPPGTIGQIDGDVKPMSKRDTILRESRVVIMTPDVCHAWLMRIAAVPAAREFLSNMRTVIIDEAHTYESVLGSNSAYLFRRLITAAMSAGATAPPRFIAATATILTPEEHLRKLTGQEFTAVLESENGAPRHVRSVHHLAGENEDDLTDLLLSIINNNPDSQVIAFHDSRQGVERIAQAAGRRDEIMPYRSGYLAEDRRMIENSLREGKLRAVIATSALELGIDMPDLNYGINLSLPPSRKQFHQRLGRVGRARPGTFIILDQANRFSMFGDTLKNYFDNSVEPSQLYIDNEYIAFQQSLCLKSELKTAGEDTATPPRHCIWPAGFDAKLKSAHGRPPAHLADIAARAAQTSPHIAYSLRDSSDEHLEIMPEGQNHSLGSIDAPTAMREAYPGATYRHRGQSYRVEEWKRRQDQQRTPYIKVTPMSQSKRNTAPVICRVVTLNLNDGWAVDGRTRTNTAGTVAELTATVTESVEGFVGEDDRIQYYERLKEIDPRKTRKQREVPTTAVYIEMADAGFTGDAGDSWRARKQVADALYQQLLYQKSIKWMDVHADVENIFIETREGYFLTDNAIIVYDNIYGGIGLVDDLYQNLPWYAQRLSHAACTDADASLKPETAGMFAKWLSRHDAETSQPRPDAGPGNWWRVIKPGSPVTVFSKTMNRMTQGTIEEYCWNGGIRYQVRTEDGEAIEARDRQLVAATQEFSWQIWQPESNRIQRLYAN